jgi:hypothetical protein
MKCVTLKAVSQLADALHLREIAMNLFAIKVVKCILSSILTPNKILLNDYNWTNCQKTQTRKVVQVIGQLVFFLNYKTKNKTKKL